MDTVGVRELKSGLSRRSGDFGRVARLILESRQFRLSDFADGESSCFTPGDFDLRNLDWKPIRYDGAPQRRQETAFPSRKDRFEFLTLLWARLVIDI